MSFRLYNSAKFNAMSEKSSCPDRQVLGSERGKSAIASVALLMTAVDNIAVIERLAAVNLKRTTLRPLYLAPSAFWEPG
jgi:hypothetical protein